MILCGHRGGGGVVTESMGEIQGLDHGSEPGLHPYYRRDHASHTGTPRAAWDSGLYPSRSTVQNMEINRWARAFNPSTWEERQVDLWVRDQFNLQKWVPGEPELHRETQSWTQNKTTTKLKKLKKRKKTKEFITILIKLWNNTGMFLHNSLYT